MYNYVTDLQSWYYLEDVLNSVFAFDSFVQPVLKTNQWLNTWICESTCSKNNTYVFADFNILH